MVYLIWYLLSASFKGRGFGGINAVQTNKKPKIYDSTQCTVHAVERVTNFFSYPKIYCNESGVQVQESNGIKKTIAHKSRAASFRKYGYSLNF